MGKKKVADNSGITEHSKNFEKVKKYYDDGIWSKARVYNAVGKWITAAEYEEITGEPYEED
jgi:hypothetical protein